MKALRGAPHIAALHNGLEYNRKTDTLSFFMDYYRGKDLDRQIQMLRGAAYVQVCVTGRSLLTRVASVLLKAKSLRLGIRLLLRLSFVIARIYCIRT